jgi:septum site-determining protein MinC
LARQRSKEQQSELAASESAPASFEIKSANLPLVALLLKSPDPALLEREFAARFRDIPEFFDGDPLVVDLSRLDAPAADIDFPRLLVLLRKHRLSPIAIRGGSEPQISAAAKAGLVRASDTRIDVPVLEHAVAPKEMPPAVAREEPGPEGALLVDKPLRSGQQVYARGRDLVVLAMVNAGAEVIADGNIHVYAPLRGRAIAGARGNSAARIFSLALEPELISIAGVYRTAEIPLPDAVRGKPAQVRLSSGAEGEKLVAEPLRA